MPSAPPLSLIFSVLPRFIPGLSAALSYTEGNDLRNGTDSQFLHGLAHNHDIVRWNVGLHVVDHSSDKATAGAKLSDAKLDLLPDFFRRSSGQHMVVSMPPRASIDLHTLP